MRLLHTIRILIVILIFIYNEYRAGYGIGINWHAISYLMTADQPLKFGRVGKL